MARTDGIVWIVVAAVVGFAALAVGCSPTGNSQPVSHLETPSADNSFVRFIDGSPDATPQGGSISIATKSGQLIGTVAYRHASKFFDVTRALNADFTITSTSWPGALGCTTPFALQPGAYYTIVVAGSPSATGNQGLQCHSFSENFTTTATQPVLLFHHASPAAYLAGQQTLLAGTFSPAQGTFGKGGSATQSPTIATATFNATLAPPANTVASGQVTPVTFGASGTGGIGFYVVPSSAPVPTPTPGPSTTPAAPTPMPTPAATIVPSQAQLGAGDPGALPDMTNAFPVASSTVFSLYAIDAPIGTASPAPPFVLLGLID